MKANKSFKILVLCLIRSLKRTHSSEFRGTLGEGIDIVEGAATSDDWSSDSVKLSDQRDSSHSSASIGKRASWCGRVVMWAS